MPSHHVCCQIAARHESATVVYETLRLNLTTSTTDLQTDTRTIAGFPVCTSPTTNPGEFNTLNSTYSQCRYITISVMYFVTILWVVLLVSLSSRFVALSTSFFLWLLQTHLYVFDHGLEIKIWSWARNKNMINWSIDQLVGWLND